MGKDLIYKVDNSAISTGSRDIYSQYGAQVRIQCSGAFSSMIVPNIKESPGKEEMTPLLPQVWIVVLLHLRVGLSLYVIPKCASQALEGSHRQLPPLKVNSLNGCGLHLISPEGKPLCSHMVGWKYLVTWIPPLWLSAPYLEGCTRKVTYPSIIVTLGGLTLEIIVDDGVLHLRVGVSLFVILKHASQELEGTWRLLLLFIQRGAPLNGWMSQPPPNPSHGQAPSFPHGWLKCGYPLYEWVCIGNKVLGKSPIWALFRP